MSKIPETQLEPTQLNRLAAQRQLYSNAKAIHAVQMVLGTLGPPILAVLVAFCSLQPVWAASCAIIVTCLNVLWLNRWQKTLKQKAANIQELFDCDVLELPRRKLSGGSSTAMTELVGEYSSKYSRKDPNYCELKNWYPTETGKLPLYLARVICQRANCRWDSDLRRRYANGIIAVLGFLTVATFCFGLVGDLTLRKFILAVAAPLMPAFLLGIQQYKAQIECATRLDSLRIHAEELWDKAVDNASPIELTVESRELQDAIYEHRRTCPITSDWLHRCLKHKQEDLMNLAAHEMVNEALKSVRERKKRKF